MSGILAIDTVVNPITPDILKLRPAWGAEFHQRTFGRDASVQTGHDWPEMIAMMDAAGIDVAFLVATKTGQLGIEGSWHLPYEIIADAIQKYPTRFRGLAGIDPTEGMKGVRALEHSVKEYGFIGAHMYPHWFELRPDHARWYPFYAKCVELGIPVQMQVGQSLIYDLKRPLRSVAQPIMLDAIACDFPELKLVGIHIGIPWHNEMIAMAWKHKNVFIIADAYAPKHWPKEFVRYIDSYGQDKVMFGTDFPVLTFERMRREVDGLGLREGPMRKFMRENAMRVYGL